MLVDTFGRKIEYIRISVTKQCNFRCQYCMPDTPDDFKDNSLIPLNKTLEFLKVAIDEGVKKIRITGGEPLLRDDLSEFIALLRAYSPTLEIALTTNGFFLKKYAQSLKDAGLNRLNVSLDTLNPQKLRLISKRDALHQVLEGLEEAKRIGFPIKINMVPLKTINDNEVLSMLDYCLENGFFLRYIEFMENSHANQKLQGMSEQEILELIAKKYTFEQVEKKTIGPAKEFAIQSGRFGIIAPHNDDFCKSCNRVRLTSEGTICPCLYYQEAVNARDVILQGDVEGMREALKLSVYNKPEKNQWDHEQNQHSSRAFYYTGG
ncbi:GTP 3',8-cyclase MoaA [Helicobacter cholecystus]|uniref:GTP 3',8-cyclase MoaA n=1 Tax=Helicobacter cholecystus TaxID=45498 RepID=UPI002738CD98|nr:GTP 3',8-cyclase MoaA [Helicobacter cholecystus]